MTDEENHNPFQNMTDREKREFEQNYKNAYKKNIIPKLEVQAKVQQQQQQQRPWKALTLEERIETIARLTVAHENALKEFGPVLGLVMECLCHEGMLEKAETNDKGRKVTQWRLKQDSKIMVQKKGERVHEL